MNIHWLGEIDFDRALDLQNKNQKLVSEKNEIHIIGCEHPTVITLGIRATESQDIETHLRNGNQIPIRKITRGGHATLHSPGQLVIYPNFPWRHYKLGPQQIVETLLQTTKSTLLSLGVHVFETGSPGLWTEKGKIVSIGIRVLRNSLMHGISIHLSNDLNVFQGIRACGVENASLDKVGNYHSITTEQLFQKWCRKFEAVIHKN